MAEGHNITIERLEGKILAECSCGKRKLADAKTVGEWATAHQENPDK